MYIVAKNFYEDCNAITAVVDGLQYVDGPYGAEVDQFNLVTDTHAPMVSFTLRREVEMKDEYCVFRRPLNNIHFEVYRPGVDLMCVVAMKPVTIHFYKYLVSDSTFYNSIPDMDQYISTYPENFELENSIYLNTNDYCIFSPHTFRSYEGSLIQALYCGILVGDNVGLPEEVEISEE